MKDHTFLKFLKSMFLVLIIKIFECLHLEPITIGSKCKHKRNLSPHRDRDPITNPLSYPSRTQYHKY